MMARWTIGMVLLGLLLGLLNVTATDKDKLNESETDRSKRQNKQAAFKSSPREDGYVQYDPSGLGFEIHKPGHFQYQFRPIFPSENKPYSPEPSYEEHHEPYPHKPSYHEHKPYPPKPPYEEHEPEYPKPKPSYKPESNYHEEPYPQHHKPNHYENAEPEYHYFCPKIAGYESECRSAKDCSIWYDVVVMMPGTACHLPHGNPGVCCPDIPFNSKNRISFYVKLNFKRIHLILYYL